MSKDEFAAAEVLQFCGSAVKYFCFLKKFAHRKKKILRWASHLRKSLAGYFAKLGFLFSRNALTPSLQSGAQEMSPAPT